MEYRFNDEQNKNILVILIFLIIIVIGIGGLIFYTSNDKIAVMTRIDKIFDLAVNKGFDEFNKYNKENLVEDVNFKVNIEQMVDKELVSTEMLTGNIHTNLTKKNEYKIIEIDSKMQSQDIKMGIYEKEGIIYIKINNETYQLNEDAFEINDNYNIKDIQEMYNLVYKTIKKQLRELDFYRIKNSTAKETKIGIALTDKRVKEIILDSLSSLKSNEEFIELYSKINNVEKNKVTKEIDLLIQKVNDIEMSEKNSTKLEIYTSGLLNQDTNKIILTRTESGIIQFTVNMNINENGASIDLEQNNKKINLSLSKSNDMYTIILSGTNFKIKFNKQKYNFSITANYGEYNMYMQFIGEENDKGEIVGNGNIGVNLNQSNNITIKFDEKLSFDPKEENVNLGNIKSSSELFGNIMMLNQMEIY